MKILKDAEHTALKMKADAYDEVVKSAIDLDKELSAENATAEQVLAVFASVSEGESGTEELQNQLDAAVTRAETAENRVTELESELTALRAVPDGETATARKDADGDTQESIAAFADKNAGNSSVIFSKLKEEGLL